MRLLSTYNRILQRLLDAGLVPKLRVLRALNRAIRSRLAAKRVTINGHVMHLDPVDSLGLARGAYEPDETAVVESVVRPGMRVLDLGANIGYFTLLCARLAGPEGTVMAVEPDPGNFRLLERNVRANNYGDRVRLLQHAASDTPGVMRLYQPLRSAAHHSLAPQGESDPFVEVEVVRVDDLVDGAIDFMKIDVEGAELGALHGAAALIARSPNLVIMTEFNPRALVAFDVEPRAYLDFLAGLGFSFSDIDHNARAVLPRSIDEIAAIYTPANGRYTNLLCRRER